MPDQARIRRFERMIKKMEETVRAIEAVAMHEPIAEPDNARSKLRREIEEYSGFLKQATWWRA
jgi:hypothetical protein